MARNMRVQTGSGNMLMFHTKCQALVCAQPFTLLLVYPSSCWHCHGIVVMGFDTCAPLMQRQHRAAADLGRWRFVCLTALPQDTLIIQHQRFHCLLCNISLRQRAGSALHVANLVLDVQADITWLGQATLQQGS